MNNTLIFNAGAEQLKSVKVALDPYGKTCLDGYALLLVDTDGAVHVTEKESTVTNVNTVDTAYIKTLESFMNLNWKKESKPNTPSVEMLLNMYFPELSVKAYAMWANSTTGVCAQTHAVYSALTSDEHLKICDTIKTCTELRNKNTTFTMG